ncbi:unnamed protein product, partial [Cyprideis torosa]
IAKSCLKRPLSIGVVRGSRRLSSSGNRSPVEYVQGQSPKARLREYFYYVDHQGMLFLDDAKMKNFTSCFKEQKFLEFFTKRIRRNDYGRYEDSFPWVSLCGRERNYIRCYDTPVVFTDLKSNENGEWRFHYAYTNFSVPFEPQRLCELPENGRIYHPIDKQFGGVSLVRSAISLRIQDSFVFDETSGGGHEATSAYSPPVGIKWDGETYFLTNELLPLLRQDPTRLSATD